MQINKSEWMNCLISFSDSCLLMFHTEAVSVENDPRPAVSVTKATVAYYSLDVEDLWKFTFNKN